MSTATQPPQPERPEAPRVHDGVQRPPDRDDERVGPLDALQRVEQLVLRLPRLGAGDEVDQHLAVRGRLEDRPFGDQVGPQLLGIGQVAVVGEGEGALAVTGEDRLGVGEDRGAGRRVPGVTDRHVTGKAGEHRVGEDVGDEAHAAVGAGDAAAVQGDDPGRLLAAMLQAVQSQMGDAGRLGNAGNADDAAHAAVSLPCAGGWR